MAWMMFDDRESYIKTIMPLLEKADIFTLDRFCKLLIKHYWPSAYVD